jgi:hypothetical protein
LPKRLLLVPCLLLVSALVLSACGGGGSSDESQIEAAIETAVTSPDPATCTELTTQEFMEQSTSTEGPEAVKECEAEVEDEQAESAAVSKVEVEGSDAGANAKITGGAFDGQSLEIGLVKDGDQWKLNEVLGFAKLDKTALVEAVGASFESEAEVSKEFTLCFQEGLEESSQPEIEEIFFSGSSEPIEELAEECS